MPARGNSVTWFNLEGEELRTLEDLMVAKKIWRGLVALVIAGLIGCVPLVPYHADQDKVAEKNGVTPAPVPPTQKNDCYDEQKKTCALFVEYDDFGHLFSRAQL